MKAQILRTFVLLVSISAVSALVWNATRKEPVEPREDAVIAPHEMQSSSKSMMFFDADGITEIVDGVAKPIVTDEEVKRTRDAMLSTSKSGRIMSDDDIRKMLEERKKEELEEKSENHFMRSPKSAPPISVPALRKILEDKKEEPYLIPSSKNPNRLLDPKDVEKIIESGASDFVKPQEPEKK